LVVVDNFSADNTAAIARRYADQFQQAGPERSRQRNLGAAIAATEFLLFVDSDMVLTPGIPVECLDRVRAGDRAVIIPEISVGGGYWSACKALERSCYVGDDTLEAPRFIDRRLFEDLSGFDERLWAGEDWDLTARIRERGDQIGRIQTALIHDEGKLSLVGAMRTKYYYGKSMPLYIRKHRSLARSQLKLLRPAFFKRRDLLMRRPWLTIGMFTLKSCEILSGGLGTLMNWRRQVNQPTPVSQ
jgi:glycosyltransferase involved in cell wall biosynthesis